MFTVFSLHSVTKMFLFNSTIKYRKKVFAIKISIHLNKKIKKKYSISHGFNFHLNFQFNNFSFFLFLTFVTFLNDTSLLQRVTLKLMPIWFFLHGNCRKGKLFVKSLVQLNPFVVFLL